MAGRLVLIATPIGNLEDLSPRASRELSEADLWYVEDTRVSGKLQGLLGVKKPMRVLNEQTSDSRIGDYAKAVHEGLTGCVVSDAGSPVVSDPGSELVRACRALGVEIDSIPGPSAVTDALALSGFYAQRFAFLGFISRKAGAATETLAPFKESALSLVLFESPHRFVKTLELCGAVLGERNYAVCRELTKMHQQVWLSRFPDLPGESDVPSKGEFTIVIEGHRRNRGS